MLYAVVPVLKHRDNKKKKKTLLLWCFRHKHPQKQSLLILEKSYHMTKEAKIKAVNSPKQVRGKFLKSIQPFNIFTAVSNRIKEQGGCVCVCACVSVCVCFCMCVCE